MDGFDAEGKASVVFLPIKNSTVGQMMDRQHFPSLMKSLEMNVAS